MVFISTVWRRTAFASAVSVKQYLSQGNATTSAENHKRHDDFERDRKCIAVQRYKLMNKAPDI